MDQYHQLEIGEIFKRTSELGSMRIKIYATFATLNVSVVTISLQTQNALFTALAGFLFIILVIIDFPLRNGIRALYARGIYLEKTYCPDYENGSCIV